MHWWVAQLLMVSQSHVVSGHLEEISARSPAFIQRVSPLWGLDLVKVFYRQSVPTISERERTIVPFFFLFAPVSRWNYKSLLLNTVQFFSIAYILHFPFHADFSPSLPLY